MELKTKIEQFLKNYGEDKVIFECFKCYRDVLVCCKVIRFKYKNSPPPIAATSSSQEDAFDKAKKLFDKVEELERVMPIIVPSLNEQPFNEGYHRELFIKGDNLYIEYKRMDDEFYITNVYRKDDDGFCYADEPYLIPNDFKFVKDLDDGYELYRWNDIQFLSGTAGDAIIKDGKVIKTKMTAIS